MFDLGPGGVIAVMAGALALVRIFGGPIGAAIADRVRGRVVAPNRALLDELDSVNSRVADLEERLDFSERLLADGRSDPLPGRAHR